MYRDINDLFDDWKEESEFTLKIFGAITDASLGLKIPGYDRTTGKVAWHIVQTLTEMGKAAGLFEYDDLADKPVPAAIHEVIKAYSEKTKSIRNFIENKITPESLFVVTEMYGEKWELRKMFYVLLKHQAHHRAQLTVLMRQAGLKVPGIYGPSKEEWAQYNMPPQE